MERVMSYPRRGEIYLVRFAGKPQDNKERPAETSVIVEDNCFNVVTQAFSFYRKGKTCE